MVYYLDVWGPYVYTVHICVCCPFCSSDYQYANRKFEMREQNNKLRFCSFSLCRMCFFSLKTNRNRRNEIENEQKEKGQIIQTKQLEYVLLYTYMRLVFFESDILLVFITFYARLGHTHKPTVIIYDPKIKIKINSRMRIAVSNDSLLIYVSV